MTRRTRRTRTTRRTRQSRKGWPDPRSPRCVQTGTDLATQTTPTPGHHLGCEPGTRRRKRRSAAARGAPAAWPRAGSDPCPRARAAPGRRYPDRKSTRLNSSHLVISYAAFCLKKSFATHLFDRGLNTLLSQALLGHSRIDSTPRYTAFFFNDTATTEISTLSLHDALPS